MHIYFLGIGGTGIGPLALIASQAGYQVSGSDAKESEYTHYLQERGINLSVETSAEHMAELHKTQPIDWLVAVSAITRQNPDEPHLKFARENGIRITERDACLNQIINDKGLKMIAAAGTQGKTTTAAMTLWAMKELGISVSHSLGAKMSFADMGHFDPDSEYFVYECDEYHRNFLHFYPELSIISGIAWDHHEVFQSPEEYNQAFREFVSQSKQTILWDEDFNRIGLQENSSITIIGPEENFNQLTLPGLYNRRNAWLVVKALSKLFGSDQSQLIEIMNRFPGTQRRMEELSANLFSDYAHTPEKIVGCLSAAKEIANSRGKKVVIIYEPLTNRRQYYVKELYRDCFSGADKIYWVPSYLNRDNPDQKVLTPEDLIQYLSDPTIAQPAKLDDELWSNIQKELSDSIVVCVSGGGGGSLDEWLRVKVREQHQSANQG